MTARLLALAASLIALAFGFLFEIVGPVGFALGMLAAVAVGVWPWRRRNA